MATMTPSLEGLLLRLMVPMFASVLCENVLMRMDINHYREMNKVQRAAFLQLQSQEEMQDQLNQATMKGALKNWDQVRNLYSQENSICPQLDREYLGLKGRNWIRLAYISWVIKEGYFFYKAFNQS